MRNLSNTPSIRDPPSETGHEGRDGCILSAPRAHSARVFLFSLPSIRCVFPRQREEAMCSKLPTRRVVSDREEQATSLSCCIAQGAPVALPFLSTKDSFMSFATCTCGTTPRALKNTEKLILVRCNSMGSRTLSCWVRTLPLSTAIDYTNEEATGALADSVSRLSKMSVVIVSVCVTLYGRISQSK